MAEDTLQELVNKPDWGSDSVMDKRATLELDFTGGVVEVDSNCSYGRLGLILLMIKFKDYHFCNICTIPINLSLNFDTSDDDTIHLVVKLFISHTREGWENYFRIKT